MARSLDEIGTPARETSRPLTMPLEYDAVMRHLLTEVSLTPGVRPDELAAFWPMVGHKYGGRLLVVGRAVNGWIDKVTLDELRALSGPEATATTMRRTAEGHGPCPMAWVTSSWGTGQAYSTARSSFWRFIRRVLVRIDPDSAQDPAWSSRLAWTNLAKLAPWGGGNPGGSLLEIQRTLGPELMAIKVETLRPDYVLVLAGRWWTKPFLERLGLTTTSRVGWGRPGRSGCQMMRKTPSNMSHSDQPMWAIGTIVPARAQPSRSLGPANSSVPTSRATPSAVPIKNRDGR